MERKVYFNTWSGLTWLIAWIVGYVLRAFHIAGSLIGAWALFNYASYITGGSTVLMLAVMTSYVSICAVSYSWLVYTWAGLLTRD